MASGYDLSVSTFSPDGKVFQVEYACKAVENGALGVAGVFRDGVVLGSENWIVSPLAAPRTRLFKVAPHVCAIVTGNLPDGRSLIHQARQECASHQAVWGTPISGSMLVDRLGFFVHSHTAVWSKRPVGASLMIAVHERRQRKEFVGSVAAVQAVTTEVKETDVAMSDGGAPGEWTLWLVDPTGAAFKYRGNCQGKGAPGAKTDLENIDMPNLSVDDGVAEFAKLLHKHHQENSREKQNVVEMMVLRAGREMPELVAADRVGEAMTAAEAWLTELEG